MNMFMKELNLRYTIPIIVIIFLVIYSNNAEAQKPNFSGTWVLDSGKTDLSKISEKSMLVIRMKVSQTDDTVSVQRFSINHEGQTNSYIERLRSNGSNAESIVNMYVKKNSNISLDTNGQRLTEVAKYIDYRSKIDYASSEIWALTMAGNVLMIKDSVNVDGRIYSIQRVYNKMK
jgi:hypothetical protein